MYYYLINKFNLIYLLIFFMIISSTLTNCDGSEKHAFNKMPFTIQKFGTNIDLCELHKMYQQSNDTLFIKGNYIPVRNYIKIYQDTSFKAKSCNQILILVSKKYKIIEKSLVIQSEKNNIKLIGLSVLFYFSELEFYELSFCFHHNEYKELENNEILKNDSIVNFELINKFNKILNNVQNFEVIQCLLINPRILDIEKSK